MRNKIIQYALPLLAVAAIITAAVYIKHTGFSGRETEHLLSVSSSPQTTASSENAPPIPLNSPVSSLPVPVPAPEEIKLSPAQMKEDLDELVSTLVQVHPRLIDGWTSEEQLVIDEAYNNIKQAHTLSEFYFIADTIVMLLHDGHTTLSPSPVQRILNLPLFWSREGLVVKDKRGQLHPGDIITAIGGRSIKDIEADLKLTIPAENENWVKSQATSLLRAEWFLQHMGLVSENSVSIAATRGNENISEEIELADPTGQKEYNPYPAHNADFTFEIEKDRSLGIFQLNTCVASEEYKSTVKRFFDEVYSQGIRNIAIDLRNNGGGDSQVIEEFLAFTDAAQYRTFKSVIRYSPQVKQQIPGSPDSGVVVNEAVLAKNILKSAHPFSGNLYVLTSPRTFSSANWFALVVQDNKLGQVIGEATGNQPSSYGDILGFQLPASGISYMVSHKKFTRPDPGRDPANAVMPDIEAYTTAQDIIDRRDAQMEKLYEVIGQKQTKGTAK